MSKLYFYYGTVNSSKTLNLLSTAHNYRSQGKEIFLIKPSLDERSAKVESRAGLSSDVDYIVSPNDDIFLLFNSLFYSDSVASVPSAILVDECQFLTESQIRQLRLLSIKKNVPVLCYGLRTKFDGSLWESSSILFALADEVREVITVCTYCSHKAVFSKRVDNNEGDISLGWDNYIPVCPEHYYC